jgi:hypothetical protein
MDRNKQGELIVLAIGWIFAVMVQYIVADSIASYFRGHSITNMNDELLVGFGVSFLISLGIYFSNWGRIELASSFILSLGLVVFIGWWPYLCSKDQPAWVYPIYFIECAPMCALIWKIFYKWVFKIKSVDMQIEEDLKKEVTKLKAEIEELKNISQVQSKEIEAKQVKEETKPIEKPIEPPEDPDSTAHWRVD